jgi:hypothetical protein
MAVTLPEGVTLTWIVRGVECIRTIEINGIVYEDVICNLGYRLRAMNQYRRGIAIDNFVEIPVDSLDPETFTEFKSMTQEQAEVWLKAQLGDAVVEQLETRIVQQLANQDYTHKPPCPWYHQDPADLPPPPVPV